MMLSLPSSIHQGSLGHAECPAEVGNASSDSSSPFAMLISKAHPAQQLIWQQGQPSHWLNSGTRAD